MSALNDYVNAVERNLIGIERRKKREILRDVSSHILSMADDYGGGEEGIIRAIEELGPPEDLAVRYVEMYASTWKHSAFVMAVSLLLAFLSLPIIPLTTHQNPFSLIFLPALMLFIGKEGLERGFRQALPPAVSSAVLRSALFSLSLWMYPYELMREPVMVGAVHVISVLIVLMSLGFPIPGKE